MNNRDAQFIEEDCNSIVDLLRSVGELNDYMYRELKQEAPNERRIFTEAMRIVNRLIKGADVIDVRLFDEMTQDLYLAEIHGELWKQGTLEDQKNRLARRYPVTDKPPTSAGAYVFQTGKVHVMPDVHADPYYSELFPETRRMIIAPIRVEDKKFGVLDIRGVGELDFPHHAASIAELIGHQLGMYILLTGKMRELQSQRDLGFTEQEFQHFQRQQVQIFQDLSHQLRNPILQAHGHVQSALREVTDTHLRQRLWCIRGLCSKAKRVINNTELFGRLARGERVTLKEREPLSRDDLVRLLIEAAIDSEYLSWTRDIRFQVNTDSFKTERRNPPIQALQVDRNLLEQALYDILDNAGKYSYQGTAVQISVGRTTSGGFYISVTNQGLPIRASEVASARTRGWRGEAANYATGEGSGIGLWMVDQIMKAHGGELMINPTTPEHLTQIRLVFPGSSVS